MGIGAAIFLIAAGAIITFAMDLYAFGIEFDVVGAILMLVGVLGLIVTLVIYAPRRQARAGYRRTAYDSRYDRTYDYDY